MIGVTQLLNPIPFPATQPIQTQLTFHLDPGNTDSYSGTGTTWTDMITNTNGTIPSTWNYSSDFGGVFETGTAAGPNYGFNSTWLPATSGAYQDELTYEAWISIDDVSTVYNGVISSAESTTDLGLSIVTDNSGRWSGMIQRAGQSSMKYIYTDHLPDTAPTVNDKWYHVAIAADNDGHKYYVNSVSGQSYGNVIDSPTYYGIMDTSISTNDQTLGVGRFYANSTSTSFSLRGRFGPVRVYQKKLTDAEIQFNYDLEKARFGY